MQVLQVLHDAYSHQRRRASLGRAQGPEDRQRAYLAGVHHLLTAGIERARHILPRDPKNPG